MRAFANCARISVVYPSIRRRRRPVPSAFSRNRSPLFVVIAIEIITKSPDQAVAKAREAEKENLAIAVPLFPQSTQSPKNCEKRQNLHQMRLVGYVIPPIGFEVPSKQ
jgi:hypothetical protein